MNPGSTAKMLDTINETDQVSISIMAQDLQCWILHVCTLQRQRNTQQNIVMKADDDRGLPLGTVGRGECRSSPEERIPGELKTIRMNFGLQEIVNKDN